MTRPVAFSREGLYLAVGVHLVETEGWSTERTLSTGLVSSVAFSPNGMRLASGAWDGTVKLWNVQEREQGGGGGD